MLLWYSSKFRHLSRWCFYTAVGQFLIFLFLFLCVSYLSTSLHVEYVDGEADIISEYEKYIVLATSLYMVVPFAFSTILIFGLFHKNQAILKAFIIGSLVDLGVILITVIGSGIFLAIKGTAYVAYTLIGYGIVLELLLVHGILLVLGIKEKYANKSDGSVTESVTEEI